MAGAGNLDDHDRGRNIQNLKMHEHATTKIGLKSLCLSGQAFPPLLPTMLFFWGISSNANLRARMTLICYGIAHEPNYPTWHNLALAQPLPERRPPKGCS